MQKKPLFHLCIPGPLERRSTLTAGICLQSCRSGLLLAGEKQNRNMAKPSQGGGGGTTTAEPFRLGLEGNAGSGGAGGRCIPRGAAHGVPVGAGGPAAGSHPRCPTAKFAAAPPAALAPCSQLFPPWAPDVSHYPNCNQPGSACFPDSGACLFLWGCSTTPPHTTPRLGKGRVRPHSPQRASPARALTCPTDGRLAADQLPKEKTRAGSRSAWAERGLRSFVLAALRDPRGCGVGLGGDGHGGWVDGEFPAVPHGCQMGWGLIWVPRASTAGTGWQRWLSWLGDDALQPLRGCRRARLKLCPCQQVAEPCGVPRVRVCVCVCPHPGSPASPGTLQRVGSQGCPPGEGEQDPKGKAAACPAPPACGRLGAKPG